jgi:hypothetical protein
MRDYRTSRRSDNVREVRRQQPSRLVDNYEAEDFGDRGIVLYNPNRPAWDNPAFTLEGVRNAYHPPRGRARGGAGNAMGSTRTRAAIQRMMRRD